MAGEQPVLEIKGLRKTYSAIRGRTSVAVENLDMVVPRGGVHGFLGPNGSGKTTTIRIVLGLIAADKGEVRLFGQPVPQALPSVISKVGAIVESPKFVPTFSARKNLLLLAGAIGTPLTVVDKVLEKVGLFERRNDRYATFSLGMKQRLAIAATLLKDPELLIFDEPTNGLDPAGIHEIRATMRGLADQGKTVLVSSHVLSEVEQVADTATIIGRGRMLASGRIKDLLAHGVAASATLTVPGAPEAAVAALTAAGMVASESAGLISVTGVDRPEQITQVLSAQGIYLSMLKPSSANLESVFLELTAAEHLGAQK